MLGRLNNMITRYETERDRLKVNREPSTSERHRLRTIDEILQALYSLRR